MQNSHLVKLKKLLPLPPIPPLHLHPLTHLKKPRNYPAAKR